MIKFIFSSALALLVTMNFAFAATDTHKFRPYDVIFLDEMTAHHKEGVEMAKIGALKAKHAELRDLSKKMVEMQKAEIILMQSWRNTWYPEIPYVNHGVGMNMKKLMSLSGDEFDLAFIDSMIPHHQGAIYLGMEAQLNGDHTEVLMLGKKISRMQKEEMNKLRKWRYTWYPNH